MIIKIYIFWLFGLIVLTFLGSKLLPLNPNAGLGAIAPGKNFDYLLSLAQWDGGHFLNIAKNGYVNSQSFAFFPLYPFLIFLLSKIIKNEVLSGLIISNASFIIFLITVKKYFVKITSKKISNSTILTFIFFPPTFFCVLVYSESVFLALLALSLYSVEKNKEKLTIISSALISITRSTGIFLPFALLFFRGKIALNRKIMIFILSLLPFLVFVSLTSFVSKELFAPITVQQLWDRELSDPISTTFAYFCDFITFKYRPINDYFDFVITILFLGLLVKNTNKIPTYLWVFSICVVLLPLYSGTLTSMPRYVLPSLGVFLILGDFLEKHNKFKYTFWTLSLALQFTLAALFVNGHWID